MSTLINQKSIAVLPFNNTSSDPENQYFADGISEEIINALSKINGLKVTSRTSSFGYRNTQLDIRQIGKELSVSTVLEGSVRRAGDRVRIATQLIKADSGFQIWAQSFDRNVVDIFDLQDEISHLIAERIREDFGHMIIEDELITARTSNLDAYNSYLKGRYFQLQWTHESLQKALKAYKESISQDPNYPMPYLAISQCFVYMASWNLMDRLKGLFMAHHFMSKLGEEHAYIPEYHYTKGIFHLLGKWEFETSEKFFQKALSLNPNYADALQAQSELYNATGNFKVALECIEKALVLSPNSPNHHLVKATSFYLKGDFSKAVLSLNQCLSLDENREKAQVLKALSLMKLQQDDNFQAFVQSLPNKLQHDLFQLWRLQKGDKNESVWQSNEERLATYGLVIQGDLNQALADLKSSVERRAGQFINFMNDPMLKPLNAQKDFIFLKNHFIGEGVSPKAVEQETHASDMLSEKECDLYIDELTNCIDEETLFLNPQLSLSMVAEKLELHPNKLSWLINKRLGRGFNEYINGFRLETFKRMALLPENKHLTILGIAYESGFNSKSVFNEFFKKSTGMTPKAWIKAQV